MFFILLNIFFPLVCFHTTAKCYLHTVKAIIFESDNNEETEFPPLKISGETVKMC